jgi:DNA-binding transcriptional LysR family regulator
MDEAWLYGEPGNAPRARISKTIAAKTGRRPRAAMYTTSMRLRLALLASGDPFPAYRARFTATAPGGKPIKALPAAMPLKLPVAILTLKNRTLSPAVQPFIETAREAATTMQADA